MANSQNYQNHVRWLPAFHFFAVPVLLIHTLNEVRHLYASPSGSTAFAVVVAAALLTVAFLARIQALTAQDRLIHLEMRLRLQTLDPGLLSTFSQLTPGQVVALRFAGDAELPELIRSSVANKTKPADIKKAIKQWKPDLLRV